MSVGLVLNVLMPDIVSSYTVLPLLESIPCPPPPLLRPKMPQ